MFDQTLTRFGNATGGGGVSSSTPNGFTSDLSFPPLTAYHSFFTDFDSYASADWTATTVTSGSPTQALVAANNGVLAITNTNGTSDSTSFQLKNASFQLAAGLRAWGRYVFKVSSTAPNLFMGLANTTTTPIAAVTDGIWLSSVGTALTVNMVANSGTAQTLTASTGSVPTLVANQYLTFSWYYDGAVYSAGGQTGPQYGRVVFQLTGAGVSASWRNEIACSSTFPFTTLMTPQMALQNTTAIASVLSVDALWVIEDRTSILATPTFG